MMDQYGIDEIMTQGTYAYYDGCQIGDCPYDEGSEEYTAWTDGWARAQDTEDMADEYQY